MFAIGMDLGNASAKIAVISSDGELCYRKHLPHYGKPLSAALILLREVNTAFEKKKIIFGAFTGVNAGLLCDKETILNDIPAIDKGIRFLCPEAKSVIEIGSQNGRFLTKLGQNTAPLFAVNESCAGGTGSFFEDQMYRLKLKTEDYSTIVEKANSIPRLSGRCSVFAKTDIIHRQQEGVPTPDILLGLCYATIRNFKATIIKNLPIQKPLALCGGIVQNKGVIRAVKDIFELSDDEFFVSDSYIYVQAVGAAVYALEKEADFLLSEFCSVVVNAENKSGGGQQLLRLPPLHLGEGTNISDPVCAAISDNAHCTLGIDVGSTSTNLVLTDRAGNIVDFQYLRTLGDPQSAVREGLSSIDKRLGSKVIVDAVGVTGSGRYLIGEMVGADTVKDEITAQARAAVGIDPKADTVFEIGGQDSKYISLKNGMVSDFQMNKICAAGTGSFLEEQAGRLNVPLSEYGQIALDAKNPVDLGERCTVFIESNISTCLAKGVETADILAGLCHSVIRNYLFKVVGNKPVGEHIVLQGGVCYNPAVVASFQAVYGSRITVSPCFSVSGAYGVSLLASEDIGESKTMFKGFALTGDDNDEGKDSRIHIEQNNHFYEKAKKLLKGNYTGKIDSGKQTIGVPYVLVVHKFFPMIKAYFEELGYNVLLSDETDERTIALSQKYAQAETCYPVKLIYGHMAQLAEKKVDYIFLPSVLTMKHECSRVYHNYGCVYMQTAAKVVFESMQLARKGIKLLNPVFSLDFGQKAMASAMIGVGVSLGKNKALCAKALLKGAMAVRKHTVQVEKLGKELLDSLQPDEKVLVIVTRTYGIDDPVLNMGIPQELLKRGYKVITLSHLPAHSMDISNEYGNLYWPFGQHIIFGAKLIKNHPNLYAVYLTNHGCGPDTMLSHLFRQEMGDKPYLNIEVDEHFSKVGIITHLEAFMNSIETCKKADTLGRNYFENLPERTVHIPDTVQKDIPLYIPYLYPYSILIADMLSKNGYNAASLPPSNANTLALGRSKTISKEYLSFTALTGDISQKAQENQNMQILIPQTEGSETDGIYARVIYDILKREQKNNVTVVSPIMETLPFSSPLCNQFFLCLLAGDIILAADKDERETVMQRIISFNELTLEDLAKIAGNFDTKTETGKIAVLGEPYSIFNPGLNDSLFLAMEEEGRKISYMPLSEYFCFLWLNRAEKEAQKNLVEAYRKQMKVISDSLGKNSPFAADFFALCSIADNILPQFAGANGKYRLAKRIVMQKHSIACIEAASMYENTQTVLTLLSIGSACPTITMSFEGVGSIALKERLESFLYYVDSY